MTRRKMTDGKRIADRVFFGRYWGPKGATFPSALAADIDRLVRRRMAEAWDQGWTRAYEDGHPPVNPYRGRRK